VQASKLMKTIIISGYCTLSVSGGIYVTIWKKGKIIYITSGPIILLNTRIFYMIITFKQILLCSSDLRFNKIKDIEPKSLAHLTELNTLWVMI